MRRRVGGYEVPLDPGVPVSGPDRKPVRIRMKNICIDGVAKPDLTGVATIGQPDWLECPRCGRQALETEWPETIDFDCQGPSLMRCPACWADGLSVIPTPIERYQEVAHACE